MKWLIFLTVAFPIVGMANSLNNTNQPFQRGYNPSTQRMQNQMFNQQQNEQLKLQQEQRNQAQQFNTQIQQGNQTAPRSSD
ncbi:Protein of unknown function [Izhakiella capsodis]|uniref:DUF2756 domain-containing protein n=1 Tax=Izhakiella capsodis TaxID=1367852 RepID=A0A1I4YW98_9GAMM|nr:DUF2756 domain-containing protein [Izhakiella capsodis]SFN42292.1 Protein of unknown function [Izhakiella capsodis]